MLKPNRSNPITMHLAGKLRKKLTPAERKLWARLRNKRLGVSFRRQHALGDYTADFCCIKEKLIIEPDGEQHKEQKAYDEERTNYLKSLGYHVIRFWNDQVINDIEDVILAIRQVLEAPSVPLRRTPSPFSNKL